MSRCFFAAPKSTKMHPETSKRPPEAFQKAQNDPKCTPKRPQKRPKIEAKPQDEKRSETRRFQDRLGSAPRGPTPVWWHPWGTIWEAKSAPKSIRKQSKSKRKFKRQKKPIQDDLGPVLGRSWAVLGAILGPCRRSDTTPADVS